MSKTAIFCLDVRAELTDHERRDLGRYKLYDQVIYNSEASRRHLDKQSEATSSGTASGLFKGAMHLALAAMRLNVTIKSLEQGHHIECKSMEELLAAEEAFMEACRNLRLYLDIAATFNGSEVVVDFSPGSDPVKIATAAHPEPILAPTLAIATPTPPPALSHAETAETQLFEAVPSEPEGVPAQDVYDQDAEEAEPQSETIRSILAGIFLTDEGSPQPFATLIAVVMIAVLVGRCALG